MVVFQINQHDLIKSDDSWIVPEKTYGLEVKFKGHGKPDEARVANCNNVLKNLKIATEKAVLLLNSKRDFGSLEEWELVWIEFIESNTKGVFDLYFANKNMEYINVLWRVSCADLEPRTSSYGYW